MEEGSFGAAELWEEISFGAVSSHQYHAPSEVGRLVCHYLAALSQHRESFPTFQPVCVSLKMMLN